MYDDVDFAWQLIGECETLRQMVVVVRHIESLRLRALGRERWSAERRLYTASMYARGWYCGGLTSRQ